jgi:hypothetical protein
MTWGSRRSREHCYRNALTIQDSFDASNSNSNTPAAKDIKLVFWMSSSSHHSVGKSIQCTRDLPILYTPYLYTPTSRATD